MPKKHFWNFAGISPKQFQLFSQKPIFWTFQLFLSNRTLWNAIWKKFDKSSALEIFQGIFRKKKHLFFPENPKFLTFAHFLSNNSFWDAFYLKSALFNSFEKFRLLLHWNLSVFPKRTKTLTALRIPMQYYALKHILVKKITKFSAF